MTILSDQQLAADASDACQQDRPVDVQQALGELYVRGVFIRMARRILTKRGNPPQVAADDLENELYLHLNKRICQFDPKFAQFHSWLYQVTDRLLLDLLRSKRWRRYDCDDSIDSNATSGDAVVPDIVMQREQASLQKDTFCDRDWQTLCRWSEKNSQDAVLIIVGFNFYGKLDGETCPDRNQEWQRWFAEFGIDSPKDLFAQLAEFSTAADIDERVKILAECSGISAGTMQQRWHRKQHLAVQLTVFWSTWLPADCKFNPQQVQAALKHDTQERVPVLCIDSLWHRARSLEEWKQLEADFQFRGIAPMLRFLREPDLNVRLKLFAQSIHGDPDENMLDLADLLGRNSQLRSVLQV